ncbi:phytase domain-containing protein [Alcanivorax nanhaiticus]|uniref:Phytase domain-containing protein n=1 Tax=Alcanivorax nanhaiticus TaxID=1177154 RepID=A0A095TS33_9GAMM|nr:phytase [Alcanivorax nanhaiticus]KGD65178.1 phytase domain-containing protein [Alcanivorax nanhaiticus]
MRNKRMIYTLSGLTALLLALSGCQGEKAENSEAVMPASNLPWSKETRIGNPLGMWVHHQQIFTVNANGDLTLGDQVLQSGNFEGLEGRVDSAGQIHLVSVDRDSNQAVLFALDGNRVQEIQRMSAPDYEISGFCLYRDHQSLLSVFVLDERGGADQWLLGAADKALPVRHLVLPPGAESCAADDSNGTLYVAEESIGLWRYNANPEKDAERKLLDRLAPHGHIAENASAVITLPGGVALVDKEAAAVNLYLADGTLQRRMTVPDLEEPETLAASVSDAGLVLFAVDDGNAGVVSTTVSWGAEAQASVVIPVVLPSAQTDSVERFGDAADDPAIWVNRNAPAHSRVLGTDKKAGLYVYDLDGRTRQFLEVGRLNNVDLRYGLTVAGQRWDVAVASNRDNNSLHVFLIDPQSGQVQEAGQIFTEMKEIYGICLYQDDKGLYAFANDKSGLIEQWLLTGGDSVTGERVRTLQVTSQPEGCVADEQDQRLFVGEEDRAVWLFAAGADQPASATEVMAAGEVLVDDIEGMALYQRDGKNWLVVSSQGDDSYVVLEADDPHDVVGKFRIGMNAAAGIDGASETDGLDVTSVDLGGDYSRGLLVVQDGRNRLPDAPQNYKIVAWKDVEAVLENP